MKKYKTLIAMLIILTLAIVIFINKPYKSTDEYLKRNYSDLNLEEENDFLGLDILSKDIKNKKIILAGEHHNLAQNHVVELKLLKYLQKEVGVNYILEEMGCADVHFLNKYLESGDTNILKNYFNIYKGKKAYTEERYNYFVDVYKFNQTLPKEKRIKVVGADIESQATYQYLIDVIKDEDNLTNELKTLINKLKEFNYYKKDEYESLLTILNKLDEDIKNNEEKYKNIFKEDFNEFKFVIKNIIDFSKTLTTKKDHYNNIRDGYIYENFKIIDSKIENAVYFGEWGSSHIFQDTFYSNIYSDDMNFFASLLNKDVKYKNKIVSINYAYYFEKPTVGHSSSGINKDLFKDYLNSKSKATIFRLNNSKSPFNEKNINPLDTNENDYKDNPITNYFQYLILIRNSEKSKFVM